MRFYIKAIAEDEAGNLPSSWMYMAGVAFDGEVGVLPLPLAAEFVDTGISGCVDCAYKNGAYPSCYTYRGRTLEAAFDTAGQALQVHGALQPREMEVLCTGRLYDVNRTSISDHRLSSVNVEGVLFAGTENHQVRGAEVHLGLNCQSFDLDRAGIDGGLELHLRFSSRF